VDSTGGWLTTWDVYYSRAGGHLAMGGWGKNHLLLLLMLHPTLVSFILLLQDMISKFFSFLPIDLPDSRS
jgi:hypothetical protein